MSKWKDEIKSPTQIVAGDPVNQVNPNFIIQPKNSPNFTYDNIETLISAYVEPVPPKVDVSLDSHSDHFKKLNFGAKTYLQKLTSFLQTGPDKNKIKNIECMVYDKNDYESPVNQITAVMDRSEMASSSKDSAGQSASPTNMCHNSTDVQRSSTFTLPRINKSSSGTNTPTTTTAKPTTNASATATMRNHDYNDETGFIKSGRERISSSHYSTGKSGSSGYYGSNLYSTSSVSVIEENIYSEPVIESMDIKLQQQSAAASSSKQLSQQSHVGKVKVKNTGTEVGGERLAFSLGAKVSRSPNGNSKHKEIECLESLKQSITNLENCLQNQQPDTSLPPASLPNGKMYAGRAELATPFTINLTDEKESGRSEKYMYNQVHHMYNKIDQESSSSSNDGQIPRPIWPNDYDDLLLDINLDEFLLKNETSRKEQQKLTGHVNPIFERSSSDDDVQLRNMENSDGIKSLTNMTSQYEELISFHRTRDILEQIRGKLNNLLHQYTESTAKQHSLSNPFWNDPDNKGPDNDTDDLENNIVNLRNDLDSYLKIMSEQSENEIKVFCDGLSRNTKMLTLKNAMSNRDSVRGPYYSESEYEIYDISYDDIGRNNSLRQYHSSIRMPRDSMVVDDGFTLGYDEKINPFMNIHDGKEKCKRTFFPVTASAHHYENCDVKCKHCDAVYQIDKKNRHNNNHSNNKNDESDPYISDLNQMQQNLSIQGIMLMNSLNKKSNSDKEKILLEYHKNKPSIWEMYYGANRSSKPHQSLIRKIKLGGKNALSISYPSTRPESDFTLDVPRAEQLKIKMQQEKQFRHRCRITIYLLSLIVFLAIVMIVSLILTRGKRMFGSMI